MKVKDGKGDEVSDMQKNHSESTLGISRWTT